VTALERLFCVFKLVQAVVFGGWIVGFADGGFPYVSPSTAALAGGAVLVVAGQVLNWATFWRLGRLGTFYGVRFGHEVPWCRSFPFNLIDHPQYVGTVLTIWGIFLLFRFPAPDWVWIPALETAYYALGAHFEGERYAHGGADQRRLLS